MTITYSLDVASSSFLGFHRLLLRWKGSIWKSILPELACWLFVYFALSVTYRYSMNQQQQMLFEDICVFFNTYSDYIPITFMLGFYVSAVFTRWGEIFMNLGWIDSPALLIATIVRGSSEEARNIRRNIVRYLVLVQAMVYRDISTCVKKRFPTMDHMVTAGIMTTNELREFDAIETEHIKYWTPIQWAFLLLRRARDKGLIDSDIIYVDMLEKIRQYRVNVLTLTLYDWVPIPLVYTQVVNLAIRSYFLIALLGRQFLVGERMLEKQKTTIDLFVPVMTILQFLFYMGWIKVAEVLLNPLGEDDDDFETNWIIDRNLQVGLCIVDDCYGRVPGLERDQFWEQSNPQLLYTAESASRTQHPMMGSCNDTSQQEDMLLLHPRRRRLMSTATGPEFGGSAAAHFNKAFRVDEGAVEAADIVPVQNHNPNRRISVVHNAYADGPSRLFENMKRKFSRASPACGKPGSPNTDLERSPPFERLQRNSTKSVISNASTSDIPVQNFLWGGKNNSKTTTKQNQIVADIANTNKPLNIIHDANAQQPQNLQSSQQNRGGDNIGATDEFIQQENEQKSPRPPLQSSPQNQTGGLPIIQEEESYGGNGGRNSQKSSSVSLGSASLHFEEAPVMTENDCEKK